LSVESKTVESSGRGKEIGGSGGPGRGEETGVDDGWKSGDTGLSDSNDEGGSEGVSRVELETSLVGWNENTNDEGTTEVEDQDSDVNLLDGRWEGLSGVSGLGGGDSDNLGTNVGEGGLGQDGPETEELTQRSGDLRVLGERSWFPPVLETDDLTGRSTASRDDDTEENETDNRQDFDGSEPELAFSVDTGTKEIDDDDYDET
jgi:hypothetical protein